MTNSYRFDRLLINLLVVGAICASEYHCIASDSRSEFIETHCMSCHSGTDPAGHFSIEALKNDVSDEEAVRRWVLVHDRIAAGEMPPATEANPTDSERRIFLEELANDILDVERPRNGVILRRLNRNEYQNTVRDLFKTDVAIHGLPEDAAIDGFDTVGEGLSVSAEAMQAYLDAADQTLDAVFGPPKEPQRIYHETNLLDQVDWKGRPQLENQIGKMFRKTDDGLVIFQSNYCPTNLVNFARLRAPAGTYLAKFQVRAIQSDKPVTLRIYAGDTIVNRSEQHLVGYYDVPPNEWTTIQFTDKLVEDGGTFLPKCYGTRDTRQNADTYPEPGIEIGDIVIEGPLEAWPPISRSELLGDLDIDKASKEDAAQIIRSLLPQAFRRPTDASEAASYLDLFAEAQQQGRSFESALRVSLKAILCSPEFLFLDEPVISDAGANTISQHALAARLSYFLWSSMPDDELTKLANEGRLRDRQVLYAQVERLLNSPKATEFTKNFAGQWLDLRDINFTEPDANLYPEFDELLRISMVQETELFFEAILKDNLNIINFVDSNFTFLNERLAKHYGIEGIEGQLFQRIELPPDSVRGGLLTQASILKVTANGTYTSPVLRGVWILDNILGTPTSPPPSNVGSVEPDIRGATTIREQLAKHRQSESCSGCHSRIDPPGFALECFDPIGGFRTRYRTMADKAPRPDIKQAPFTFEWVRYRIGQPVDATAELRDGSKLENVEQFKRYIAANPDQLTKNLAEKLLTYSLGRRIGFSDREAVTEIVRQTSEHDYGFRTLIHAVVASPLFEQP